ncbi:transmembrane protein 120 homolog [Artemia franciscana]|uniref:Transmembrane protein 120 homolog n=1 Tax=Artemia franciscana TaxID=6661 RepID=A0AA88IM01_ARTSF|nr:hypothetical protein QYM36_001744 [Artemia franciscana]KAK2723168.1 hypothetical protein QYM36_001744 [Artemia franciscana]KAK2723169.1 hypothetical protein QYM36_001744 [Artemia franciscana]
MEIFGNIESCVKEWTDLTLDYKQLESTHKVYQEKLQELSKFQSDCISQIRHQRYRLGLIAKALKRQKPDDEDDEERLECLSKDVEKRKFQLNEIEDDLPRESGLYLKIILGTVNVNILDKAARFKYKDEYEKFKLVLNLIALVLSVINLITNQRVFDLLFMFLTVWYYCTLTIRESILKVNGSKIKGWWRLHHFISTVVGGVMLTWPDGTPYQGFRQQLMWFHVYISCLQYLQFRYQQGCLYRLKALGDRHNMDITIEGFHSWMWRGLTFLLPFLYIGYGFQCYNSYKLYKLSFVEGATWQIPALSLLFLTLFLGNTITTSLVIPQKIKDRVKLKYRYVPLNKYLWSHSKRRARKITHSDSTRSSITGTDKLTPEEQEMIAELSKLTSQDHTKHVSFSEEEEIIGGGTDEESRENSDWKGENENTETDMKKNE